MSRFAWITGGQIEAVRRAAKRTQARIDWIEKKHEEAVRQYDLKEKANRTWKENREAMGEEERRRAYGQKPHANLSRPHPPAGLQELHGDLIHLADLQASFAASRHPVAEEAVRGDS